MGEKPLDSGLNISILVECSKERIFEQFVDNQIELSQALTKVSGKNVFIVPAFAKATAWQCKFPLGNFLNIVPDNLFTIQYNHHSLQTAQPENKLLYYFNIIFYFVPFIMKFLIKLFLRV